MAGEPPTESGPAGPAGGAVPPPGWYSDPLRPGQTRWWDGSRWGITDSEWGATSSEPPAPVIVPAAAPPQVVYVEGRRTNGFAIASMVLGILWIYWIGSILALVFGYIARSQIRRSEGMQSGGGMAIAGIVLGWIGIGVLVLLIALGVGFGLYE